MKSAEGKKLVASIPVVEEMKEVEETEELRNQAEICRVAGKEQREVWKRSACLVIAVLTAVDRVVLQFAWVIEANKSGVKSV